MGGTSVRNRAVGLVERERGAHGKQLLRKLLGPFCMFSHWICPPSNSKVSNGERLPTQQDSHIQKHKEIKRALGFVCCQSSQCLLFELYYTS